MERKEPIDISESPTAEFSSRRWLEILSDEINKHFPRREEFDNRGRLKLYKTEARLQLERRIKEVIAIAENDPKIEIDLSDIPSILRDTVQKAVDRLRKDGN